MSYNAGREEVLIAVPVGDDGASNFGDYQRSQPKRSPMPFQQIGKVTPTDAAAATSGMTFFILCFCCFAFLTTGIVLVALAAVGVLGKDTTCSFTLDQEIRNSTDDHIGIVFSACPSIATFFAFTNAANRWNTILAGTKFPSSDVGGQSLKDLCGADFLQTEFSFPNGETLDHLIIFVEPIAIDGVSGVLAQAGPCNAFVQKLGKPVLPIVGGMQFDDADLAALETEGTLEAVITHEMAHVLGLGTVWTFLRQGGSQALLPSQTLLQDPIFSTDNNGNTQVNPNANPKFIGSNAIDVFNDLQIAGSDTSVPVEDGRDSSGAQTFNIAAGDGQGSIDGHWKITEFGNELMTFAIDPSDATHPLSRMTLESLADLGYTVNADLADDYSLPGLGLRSSSSGNRACKLLRGSNGDGSGVHYLGGDIKTRFNLGNVIPLPLA